MGKTPEKEQGQAAHTLRAAEKSDRLPVKRAGSTLLSGSLVVDVVRHLQFPFARKEDFKPTLRQVFWLPDRLPRSAFPQSR